MSSAVVTTIPSILPDPSILTIKSVGSELLIWRADPCLPFVILVMMVGFVHLLYNSSWKGYQLAAEQLLSAQTAVGKAGNTHHRAHTEWQLPISGVHSVMMEKSTLAGEGGGCTPTPFHSLYHHVQSCSVRSSWEGRHTPPISSLPLYI